MSVRSFVNNIRARYNIMYLSLLRLWYCGFDIKCVRRRFTLPLPTQTTSLVHYIRTRKYNNINTI